MTLLERRTIFLLLWASTMVDVASAGDDPVAEFSNNLIQDFGPLLALFGDQATTQYLSQSMGWVDTFIFAMAPFGIITAVVGATRVGGFTWMRAFIGRAREIRTQAEIELMSSTSQNVCELWNGSCIERLLGQAPVNELIYARLVRPEERDRDPRGDDSEEKEASSTPTLIHGGVADGGVRSGQLPRNVYNLAEARRTRVVSTVAEEIGEGSELIPNCSCQK